MTVTVSIIQPMQILDLAGLKSLTVSFASRGELLVLRTLPNAEVPLALARFVARSLPRMLASPNAVLTALGERGIVNATLIEAAAPPPALPFRSPCPGRRLDEATLTSALRDLFVARRAASSEGNKLSGDVASLAPLPQLPDEKAFLGIAPVG